MDMRRFTLWDYVRAVVDRRRLIFLNVIVVMVVSIAVSWMMPKWYKARALILPPEEQSNLAGLIGNTGLAGIAATAGSFSLPVLAPAPIKPILIIVFSNLPASKPKEVTFQCIGDTQQISICVVVCESL